MKASLTPQPTAFQSLKPIGGVRARPLFSARAGVVVTPRESTMAAPRTTPAEVRPARVLRKRSIWISSLSLLGVNQRSTRCLGYAAAADTIAPAQSIVKEKSACLNHPMFDAREGGGGAAPAGGAASRALSSSAAGEG